MFATVSIKKFPREYKDQVISSRNAATAAGRRAPGPAIWFFQDHQWKQRHDSSYKRQATSTKHHAPIFRKQQASIKLQASSFRTNLFNRQATSIPSRITSVKLQALSDKLRDSMTMEHGYWRSIRGARTKGLC
jgi:hypothetical protein